MYRTKGQKARREELRHYMHLREVVYREGRRRKEGRKRRRERSWWCCVASGVQYLRVGIGWCDFTKRSLKIFRGDLKLRA